MTRKNAILFTLTLLVVAISYLPVLSTPFIAEDYLIYSPQWLSNPLKFFYQDLWALYLSGHVETFLRPLVVLSFAFDNLLRGEGTIAPHLTNLFFHLATMGVVGLTILLPTKNHLTGNRWLGAVVGMLLFGLHPQATQVVAWVAARWSSVAGLFGILGLYSWIRLNGAPKAKTTRWRYVALLCFAAALLSKETSVIFVAAAFFWSLAQVLKKRHEPKARLDWISPMSLVALSIAYLSWRFVILGHVGVNYRPLVFSWRVLLARTAVLGWPFAGTGEMPWPSLYAAIVVACGGLITWSVLRPKEETLRINMPWGLPLAVLVLNLAAHSFSVDFIPLARRWHYITGLESRFSYFELLALSVLVGWLLTCLSSQTRRLTGAAVSLAIIAAFAWPQQYRVSCWKIAGQQVDSLLSQTAELVPNPNQDSILIFPGLPIIVRSMAHVSFFGAGLPEAIAHRYNRDDLTVDRWPTLEMLKNPPEKAYVFKYNFNKDKLKLIHKPEQDTH